MGVVKRRSSCSCEGRGVYADGLVFFRILIKTLVFLSLYILGNTFKERGRGSERGKYCRRALFHFQIYICRY